MKKIFTLTVMITTVLTVFAQAPQKMSYQCVVRITTGGLVINHAIGMKISILQGSASGTAVYVETHTATTNANGLATIEIGGGSVVSGTFAGINWGSGTYFLKTETDPTGGTSYTITGTSQLLSVPFALYAQKAGMGDNWGSQSAITDPTLEGNGVSATPLKIAQQSASNGQVLKWDGITWKPGSDLDGNLDLPYSGTTNTVGGGFSVTNSNSTNVSAGVAGISSAITGQAAGILGVTASVNGTGVYGRADASSGTNFGVTGKSDSQQGTGVFGISGATTGAGSGVLGISMSTQGSYGVKGISYATTGSNTGVYGSSLSPQGYGIYGIVSSPDGYSGYFSGGKFYISGNTGIGITAPVALLHTYGTGTGQGNVLFVGECKFSSPGAPPASGAGTRMMWYPDKAAFRAGYVDGPFWDAANIGLYSIAMGSSTTASGFNSTAMGNASTASGENSTALGFFTVAPSYCETVIGSNNTTYTPSGTTSWNLNDRLFVIGNGTGGAARSNAMTVLKNGNIGIGIELPGAKLDVNGQVKITGGSPGAGKVLTSDATGLASWQNPAGVLTLPYNGSGYSLNNLFQITNTSYSGVAISGIGSTTTGTGSDGVYGKGKKGVHGFSDYFSGSGVFGESTNDGYGVQGWGKIGVFGETFDASGIAVYGFHVATTGDGKGVLGATSSATGYSGYFDGGKFYISGKTGIGRSDPGYKLDVMGDRIRLMESGTNDWIALRTDGGSNDYLDLSWGGGSLVMQGATTDENIIMNPSINKVGIKTWTPQYDLDVNGNIRATGSVYFGGTTTSTGTAYNKPDYVFREDYDVLKTEDVELFLEEKSHLPWVTSVEQEKRENGDATDMTRMAFETLESVENIQLQVIEQQKLITNQQKEINELKTLVNSLLAKQSVKVEE